MVAQKAKVLPPVLGDLRRHPVEKGQVHCSSFPCVFIGWTSAVFDSSFALVYLDLA